MSSKITSKFGVIRHKLMSNSMMLVWSSYKSLAVSGIVLLYLLYTLLSNHLCCRSSIITASFKHKWGSSEIVESQTNVSHLVFGISGSANKWKSRRAYIESWWQRNITRGFLFLDRPPNEFLPWPSISPPYRVSKETSKYKQHNQHKMPNAIRLARVVLETLREENRGVRWYIMADDDTVFFVDNLVEVLAKYNHKKYFYVGMNSECVSSNIAHSFDMAFGGAGYALSFPLAEAVAKNMDSCIMRYPTLLWSDQILQSCVADLGVSLTQEKGFHQIDLHGDISGLLAAHPQAPAISLHHLDLVDSIFPSMNRYDALKHLMTAGRADPWRLLQQTICYDMQKSWSFSISWGYSAHIYEKFQPPSVLQRPLQTFSSWKKRPVLPFMFNTRIVSNDPCEAPHVFYFDSVVETRGNEMLTSYVRISPRNLQACALISGNSSADFVSVIHVVSPAKRHGGAGTRRECCDVRHVAGKNITEIKFRDCMQ